MATSCWSIFLVFLFAAFANSAHTITSAEQLKRLIHQDGNRYQGMLERLRASEQSSKHQARGVQESATSLEFGHSSHRVERRSSIRLPLRSGADFGAGQYYVTLKAGTPGQEFLVIADTGSDLNWLNCRHRCGNSRPRRNAARGRLFCADHSSTFKTIPCSIQMCKVDLSNLFSLTRCPSLLSPCSYDYRYADGSAAVGVFANEKLTVELTSGRKAELQNVVIGCSEKTQGQTFQLADGVLGLGYSKYSFASRAANEYGGKFSYCLVDHLSPKNVSNYLVIGPREDAETAQGKLQHTSLVLGVLSTFYAVNVEGISIGDVKLKIPSEVFDANGKGGTILDSGTSLTFLSQPAYHPVMESLKSSLHRFKKLKLGNGPLDYCFDSTGFNESIVAGLVFHLADGARFSPPVKSYVIDAAENVKCLGILSASWPGPSVIGNIMQQNHIWEFDLTKRKLGFSPSSCTVL